MNSKSVKILATLSVILAMGFVFACIKRVIPITPPPVPAPVTLNSGLLLYLPFSGNMADSSGNNNPTTVLNGAGLTSDEHGTANSAFGANGTNQVLLVTNNGSIKFDTAYSVSFNVMTLDNNTIHCYISMIDWANGNAPTFAAGTTCTAFPNRLTIAANDSTAGCGNSGYGNPAALSDTTMMIPQPGSWYNVVEVYHRGTVTTYVNGQLVGTKPGPGTRALLCPSEQIIVGGWWSGDPENLNGKIDEIRLYNRVLTSDEIAYLAKKL